jgi:hypothetical protein
MYRLRAFFFRGLTFRSMPPASANDGEHSQPQATRPAPLHDALSAGLRGTFSQRSCLGVYEGSTLA